jgi:hypothetical protein
MMLAEVGSMIPELRRLLHRDRMVDDLAAQWLQVSAAFCFAL